MSTSGVKNIKPAVLCVDSTEDGRKLVSETLTGSYLIIAVGSGDAALKEVERREFDLVLIEVMLPDTDGFRLCATLQNKKNTQDVPIILLTVKESTADKIIGFSVGADDYIAKPFDAAEFKARVESRVQKYRSRRSRQTLAETGNGSHIQLNGMRLLPALQKVFVKTTTNEELALKLTPIEFKILYFLATHLGEVHSREKLMTAVWGEESDIFDRTIDSHIRGVRSKLPDDCSFFIETVHGSGYTLSEKQTHKKQAA